MDELLEVFALEDALNDLCYIDLGNASVALLRAMGYPVKVQGDIGNEDIENFIYLIAQNKFHYNSQEIIYLKHIKTVSFLCELHYCDFIVEAETSEDSIVFLAVEINSSEKDRSDISFFISQILSKTYNGFVVLIIKNADHIIFSSYAEEHQTTFMSEWYSVNSSCMDLFPLCAVFFPYISGARTVKDYYYEMLYGFSRDYMRYPESYEYATYQALPCIDSNSVDSLISKQQLQEIAKLNQGYHKEKYGYDYIDPDNSFVVLSEEDDAWTLFELDDYVLQEELEEDDDYDECDSLGEIDFTDIDDDTLNDPIKLIRWLELRESIVTID